MTKFRVFLIRLAPTVALLLSVFALVRLLWYPGAYFSIGGTGKLMLVLAAVVLIVGPGLSALVYKPGKKGLVTDLAILAGVELLAFVIATSVMYARQPYFSVFAVDRFEAVALREVDTAKISNSEFNSRPGHEPRLVFAELPTDGETFSRLLDETVFEGKNDIDRRPEFWKPYSAGIATVLSSASPLASLLAGDDQRSREVQRWLRKQNGDRNDYVYLPLRGRAGDATIILHADVGYPVATLNVDPW